MAIQNIKMRSGNQIQAMLDGKFVATIQDIRMNDDYGPEPASGIGDIHVLEYVPTMARHTLQVSHMVMKERNLRSAGISLENGDDALRGMEFDIEVLDRESGEVLRKYTGCSFASGDVDVRKHAILISSATFNARDVVGTIL
jgi:hypothetical protein